jgi:ComEC/Rec2-related protein
LSGNLFLRNILKEKRKGKTYGRALKKVVHFFGMGNLLLLTALIALARVGPLLQNEKEISALREGFTEGRISFEGYIQGESDKRYRIQQLEVVQLEDIFVRGKILDKKHGYILVRPDNYEKFSVGQVCRFNGLLVEPENFDDFDYNTYLKNQRIFFILDNPTYYCFDPNLRRAGNPLVNFLNDFKENLIADIDTLLQEPYSSVLVGMLFGKRRRLQREFQESIRVAGVSHVITASGYNITILIVMVNKFFLFLPKRIKTLLCFVFIWLFAIFSGFGNSIVRACIMNSLSLVALLFGRENRIHISLPLACAIFVFLDPLIVLNVGFFLSISAILGLVYISPILLSIKETVLKNVCRRLKRRYKPKRSFAQEYIFPTLSCTIGTLPVAILTFKTFSIWAIPVNTLLLPIIEGTMLWGVLSVLFLKLHHSLSNFLFLGVTSQLKYLEYIVESVGELAFGSWEISEGLAKTLSFSAFLIIILIVIYFYPIDNEKYNYYLKDN